MFFYENNRFGLNGSCAFAFSDMNYKEHIHRSFEYITVTKGQLLLTSGKKRLIISEGEGFLVLPNQLHGYASSAGTSGLICIFSPDDTTDFFCYTNRKTQKEFVPLKNDAKLEFDIKFAINNKLNNFGLKSFIYSVCSFFYGNCAYVQVLDSTDFILSDKILKEVQENFLDNLSLKIISKKLGYNYSYISRLINRYYNMNFKELINQYRVSYSLELLNAGMGISEVALKSGFESIRSYNRNFFNFMGSSPSEWLKHKRR